MRDLNEAVRLIESQLSGSKPARCVIADDGCPDESTLMGTRDGYLMLAKTLIEVVIATDSDPLHEPSDDDFAGGAFDDRIKSVMYQLPTPSAWIVGCYVFQNHPDFIAALRQLVDPQIGYPLTNDPYFGE